VGGIVVMRYRENPRAVIQRVLAKIADLERDLGGIRIRPVYDRTQLIDETVQTLTQSIAQETIITIVITVLFLLHFRASLMIAVTLPLAVLLAWMAQNGRPLVGMLLLTSFGAGQVLPLLLVGTAAASLPSLLGLRRIGQWIPPISGVVLLTTGSLTLLAHLS